MRQYQYKIQWLFNVRGNFITPDSQLRKELYQAIKILGAKSLDKILFRNENLDIIDTYSSMHSYSFEQGTKKALKYIKKQIRVNKEIHSVELLRK